MADRATATEPIPYASAFRETSDVAAQSQAAILLLIGAYLADDPTPPLESLGPRAFPVEDEILPDEDRERMDLPPIEQLLAVRGTRFDVNSVRESLPPLAAVESALDLLPRIADRFARQPEALSAAQLCEVALGHPDELVRVAAASTYSELILREQQDLAVSMLAQGAASDDSLVRDVAATALARITPEHPRLAQLIRPATAPKDREPTHTALIIHGTWARRANWWQPGSRGNLHEYLKRVVDPTLYSGADRFHWSGLYSDHARDLAALELTGWVKRHHLEGLDLFTHSHGGSVAMQANRLADVSLGRLVLLSCPVHIKYQPDFSLVTKAVSIRVHMDLVILADRGGQRFRHPSIQEIVLPIWFNHFTTHYPSTWITHKLPSRI